MNIILNVRLKIVRNLKIYVLHSVSAFTVYYILIRIYTQDKQTFLDKKMWYLLFYLLVFPF